MNSPPVRSAKTIWHAADFILGAVGVEEVGGGWEMEERWNRWAVSICPLTIPDQSASARDGGRKGTHLETCAVWIPREQGIEQVGVVVLEVWV